MVKTEEIPKLYARAQIIAFKCSQINTEFNKTLDNLVRSVFTSCLSNLERFPSVHRIERRLLKTVQSKKIKVSVKSFTAKSAERDLSTIVVEPEPDPEQVGSRTFRLIKWNDKRSHRHITTTTSNMKSKILYNSLKLLNRIKNWNQTPDPDPNRNWKKYCSIGSTTLLSRATVTQTCKLW